MTAQEIRQQTQTLLTKSSEDEIALNLPGLPPSIAAFHGQQAIEKLLKAWLFALGVEAPRTHNFKELTKLLELKGCVMPTISLPLGVFSDFAVQWRYEDLPQQRVPDLVAMQQAVRDLRSAATPQITNALNSLQP